MTSPPAAANRLSLASFAALLVLLVLGLVASLHLSHSKLFWQDELFEFFSDTRPTFAAVLHGQRVAPFSLEPPAFHLLLHAMDALPLRPETSLRLPAALGLLLTQLSAFFVALRLTRSRAAALLAAILPFLLATLDYSAEARVYSLLTGFYALSFLCYTGTLASSGRTRRLCSVALFLCLSTCVLLHFFGALLPLPFLAAELLRRPRSRATLIAVLGSLATFALNLPFVPAAREIQRLYFDSGEARLDMTLFTYVWLILRSQISDIREQGGAKHLLLCIAAAVSLGIALFLLVRHLRRPSHAPADQPIVLALGAGLLLPILAVLIGMATSHAYSPRYSLPVVVPVVVLIALFVAPLLQRHRLLALVVPLTLAVGLEKTIHQGRQLQRDAGKLRTSLVLSPAITRALAAAPDSHIYLQDTAHFLPVFFYAPPELHPRIVLLQSVNFEYKWNHSATSGLFARNMHRSTTLPVTTWEERAHDPRPVFLVVYRTGADWLLHELPADGITPEDLGPAFGGELLRFKPPPTLILAPTP